MVSRFFSSMSPKPFQLYLDSMSQPCRALEIFLKVSKVPYEPVFINLGKGQHLTEEFEKLNPFHKVPVINDNGFVLTESVAIFRHICRNHKVMDKWYPKDGEKRARVDEYLEWQHIGLRAPCALYVWATFFTPLMSGQPSNPNQVASRKNSMIKALDDLTNVWLKGKPFISGQSISFADVLAACEVEELILSGYDFKEGRPVLVEWMERVRAETNPFYDQVHQRITKVSKNRDSFLSKL